MRELTTREAETLVAGGVDWSRLCENARLKWLEELVFIASVSDATADRLAHLYNEGPMLLSELDPVLLKRKYAVSIVYKRMGGYVACSKLGGSIHTLRAIWLELEALDEVSTATGQ